MMNHYTAEQLHSNGSLLLVCPKGHSSFFFSSRIRHTRCSRDWSSDVCSSDLGLHGPPSQEFLRLRTRRRVVERHEDGEEAEVVGYLLAGDADHRQVQMATDDTGDITEWHTLIADPVQPRPGRGGFQRQPEQAGRVEPMHGRPAVRSVADEG